MGTILETIPSYSGSGFDMYDRDGDGHVVCSAGGQQVAKSLYLESAPANVWRLYTCVYNGSDILGYVNGGYVGDLSGLANIDITGSSLRLGFGYGGSYFNGSIDEVRIWNRSLSSDEVKSAL